MNDHYLGTYVREYNITLEKLKKLHDTGLLIGKAAGLLVRLIITFPLAIILGIIFIIIRIIYSCKYSKLTKLGKEILVELIINRRIFDLTEIGGKYLNGDEFVSQIDKLLKMDNLFSNYKYDSTKTKLVQVKIIEDAREHKKEIKDNKLKEEVNAISNQETDKSPLIIEKQKSTDERYDELYRNFIRSKSECLKYSNSLNISKAISSANEYDKSIQEIVLFVVNEMNVRNLEQLADFLNNIQAFKYTKYGAYTLWNKKWAKKLLLKYEKLGLLKNVKITDDIIESI